MSNMNFDFRVTITDEIFNKFRDLIHRETGIFMNDSKKVLLSNRLRKRVTSLGLKDYEEYYKYLIFSKNGEREIVHFINAISTNETYFFRSSFQFDLLKRIILPELLGEKKVIKIWSAGCATGEEPYTINIVARELLPEDFNLKIKIIGTDINTEVIERAREGIFNERSLRNISTEKRKKYFDVVGKGLYKIKSFLKENVEFKVHNLIKDKPPGYEFDIIFCRNVMIYFDPQTQKRLVDELFVKVISKSGYLFVGSCESLIGKSDFFKYRKILESPVYQLREGTKQKLLSIERL